jgi:hypothetical protein
VFAGQHAPGQQPVAVRVRQRQRVAGGLQIGACDAQLGR